MMIMNNKLLHNISALITIAPMLLACSATADRHTSFNVSDKSIIALRVGDIEMIDQTHPRDNILAEESFDAKQAMLSLIGEKLRAAGNKGVMKVTIEDASFTQTPLKQDESSISSLESEKLKFDGSYKISLNLIGDTGPRNYNITTEIKARTTRTIEGYYSVNDKKVLLQDMRRELLQKLEQQLVVQSQKAFGDYIVR